MSDKTKQAAEAEGAAAKDAAPPTSIGGAEGDDFAPPTPMGMTVQYGFVVSAAGLMFVGVWVIATWIQVGLRGGSQGHHLGAAVRLVPPSQGTRTKAMPLTQPLAAMLALQSVPSTRTLKQYYSRRAYPGAPPFIPHPVARLRKGQPLRCLSCHQEGGYVPALKAYTPVVPHPELINCVQCHTSRSGVAAFKSTSWRRPAPPRLGRSALPGGPPVIPHSLQMRRNCLACHAGPAAPKEIRTPHPARTYCQQCHVPQRSAKPFGSRFGLGVDTTPVQRPTAPASQRSKP